MSSLLLLKWVITCGYY